jgi:hypothetical protein
VVPNKRPLFKTSKFYLYVSCSRIHLNPQLSGCICNILRDGFTGGGGGGQYTPSPGQRGAIFHDKAKKILDLETK